MILHEFEGKKLFATYGILVPKGVLILKGEDGGQAYRMLDKWEVVLKAQVHERGRMERGLIRFCSSEDEVLLAAKDMRKQDVLAILIEEKLDIAEERYLSIAHNEKIGRPVLEFGFRNGERERHVLDIHADLDIPSAGFPHIPFAQAAWNLYRRERAVSLEIAPLVKTKDGVWVAADARILMNTTFQTFQHS